MFEIGEDVVCVDDTFSPAVYRMFSELPVKNQIYKVRDIDIGRLQEKTSGDAGHGSASYKILLEGINNPDDPSLKEGFRGELGFASHRFVRPEQVKTKVTRKLDQPVTV